MGGEAGRIRGHLRRHGLHTVCEEAHCPNLGECFGKQTATFLILGSVCTRGCKFCAVSKGVPSAADPEEPGHVAGMAAELKLRHVVITSVTRDDLEDGGAEQFYKTVVAVRQALPGSSVEVLTPDFKGRLESVARVAAAEPEVYNHNLETVSRLYSEARPGADYGRSLRVLKWVADNAASIMTKSGIMVGMGETRDELEALMHDLLEARCQVLTIGQYLAPSRRHWPVARYYEPEEFSELEELGRALGFASIFAGPLVRSSYSADEVFRGIATCFDKLSTGKSLAREGRGTKVPRTVWRKS